MKRIIAEKLKFAGVRDELSLRNVRPPLWAALLIFPVSIIMGDLRYLDQDMSVFGVDSTTLIFMAYGLGWLVAMFAKERGVMAYIRVSALAQAALLPFMLAMEPGNGRMLV
ncbi:MAG: hypothetical protein LBG82_00380, partial [Clostridiales Family XIII bacterium]|nr:hypothetical protein [Clostridiales Family XIII bacterium]